MRFSTLLTTAGLRSPPLWPAVSCPLVSVGGNAPLSTQASNATAWPLLVPAAGDEHQVCYTASEEARDAYLERGFCGLPADFTGRFAGDVCARPPNIFSIVVSRLLAYLGWDADGNGGRRIKCWFYPVDWAYKLWRKVRVAVLIVEVGCAFVTGLFATLVLNIRFVGSVLSIISPALGVALGFLEEYDSDDEDGPAARGSTAGTWPRSILRPYKTPVRHVTFDLTPKAILEDDESDAPGGADTPTSDEESDSDSDEGDE